MKTHIHWFRRHAVLAVLVLGTACLTAAGCIGGSRGLFSDLGKGDSEDEELTESYLEALKDKDEDKEKDNDEKSKVGRVRISDLGKNRDILKTGYRSKRHGMAGKRERSSRSKKKTQPGPQDPFIAAITERKQPPPRNPRGSQAQQAASPDDDLAGTKNPFRRIPSDSALSAEGALDPAAETARPVRPTVRQPVNKRTADSRKQAAPQGNRFVRGFNTQMEKLRTQARAERSRPIRQIPDDVAVAQTNVVRQPQADRRPVDVRGQLVNLMDKSRSEMASGKLASAYRTARLADRLAKTAQIKWPLGAQTPGELIAQIRTRMRESGSRRPSPVQLQKPALADDGSDIVIAPRTSQYIERLGWQSLEDAPRPPRRPSSTSQPPRSTSTRERLAALQERLESRSIGLGVEAEMIVDSQYVPSRLDGRLVDLDRVKRDAAFNAAQRAETRGFDDAGSTLTRIPDDRRPGLLRVDGDSGSTVEGQLKGAGFPEDSKEDGDVEHADFNREAPAPVQVEAIELDEEAATDAIQWQDGSSLSEEEPVEAAPSEKRRSSGSVLPLIVCLALGAVGVLLVLRYRRWSDMRHVS